MRRTILESSTLLAGLLSASLALTPGYASAQTPPSQAVEPAQGKDHFDKAVLLFREKDYRAALVEFRRAYDLSHNYRALYNIAQTEFEVQDYAGALRSFRKYLAAGGAEIDAERRTQVEADIKQLSGRVATITIVSSSTGAEVLVDDVVVGVTPLTEAVLVSAGRRKITLQKGDLAPVSRVLELAGGDSSMVTVNLADPTPVGPRAVPTASVAPPLPPPPEGPSRTGLWVSLTVTGLLAGGAAVTGVFALDAYNDTNRKLGTRGIAAADIDAAHSKSATLAIAADVAGAAAIAMGVATIIIGVAGGKDESGAEKPSARLRLGPQGAQLIGHF